MAILPFFQSDEELERILEPTALELGKLVFAYNRMQDKLNKLYWAMLGFEHGTRADEEWNKLRSDRDQRKLLRDAAKKKVWPKAFETITIREDIEWLLDEVDNVGERRNDSIHASFVMITDGLGTSAASNPFSGSQRSKNLVGKDLLIEFRWYRQCAETLAQYAQAIQYHVLFTDRYPQFPKRPVLPAK